MVGKGVECHKGKKREEEVNGGEGSGVQGREGDGRRGEG